MIDAHTHTVFSHDGKTELSDLIGKAKEKGLSYLAVTEHLDRDYLYCGKERFIRQLNIKKYLKEARKTEETVSGMTLAFGVECGYSQKAQKRYIRDFSKYDFDVIINSVHTIDNGDLYFLPADKISSKEPLYSRYLYAVLESVREQFDYDVVGHLGYVARYVRFDNRKLYEGDLRPIVDAILKEIIDRGKTLEINSNVKFEGQDFLPEYEIVKRYRELGGENITFGSDTHTAERLSYNYDTAAKEIKALGFTHWTVYKGRKAQKIPI